MGRGNVARRTALLLLAGCSRSFSQPVAPGPGAVYGTVVYEQPGNDQPSPASGANVSLLSSTLATTAAADGTFSLSGLETSGGTLVFSFGAGDGTTLEAAVDLGELGVGPGLRTSVGTVTLGRNAEVEGKVLRGDAPTSPTGNGGSVVFVPEGPFTTTTGDDGTFILNGLPAGSLQVSVFRTGYQPYALGDLQLQPGQELTLADVVLTPLTGSSAPGAIAGQLYFDPPLSNASGCSVTATDGASPTQGAVRASGAFTLSGLAVGLYEVDASCAGYASASVSNVLVTTGQTEAVTITLGQPQSSSTAVATSSGAATSSGGATSGGGATSSTGGAGSSGGSSTSTTSSSSSGSAGSTDGGPATVLLVDATGQVGEADPSLTIFQGLLAGASLTGYTTLGLDSSGDQSWGSSALPSAAQLAQVDTVIWFSGANDGAEVSTGEPPISTDQEHLIEQWLDLGGRHFILFAQNLVNVVYGGGTSDWRSNTPDFLLSTILPTQGGESNPWTVACTQPDGGGCSDVLLDDAPFVVSGTPAVSAAFAQLAWTVGTGTVSPTPGLINATSAVDVLVTVPADPIVTGTNAPLPIAIGARGLGTAGTSSAVYVGFLIEDVLGHQSGFADAQQLFDGLVFTYSGVP